ncbi:MAG: anthranilate phosphoribosyltransferase [Planctomycetes bacterium]|jgi:anthranilate phosphoribosyltransferase|nr:anthranilate phosphoribosyltransferase [Planctomycetota bacterium]MDP6408806.1 anthranilate phosphoribosyltransferase [Planctomycetota bacterium]
MSLRAEADRVMAGERLTRAESRELFGGALIEGADQRALADLLVALAERGETVEEIIGGAQALRAAMVPFDHDALEAVDTCGTGGDGLGSFNLSTAASLVAAAAGARVVKHGARSVSSKCGSADLLEAAGVRLELNPEQARTVFDEVGMVFLFAPAFHPAMRFVAPVRRELGIRTIFNFLGPLCSPGGVRRQLLGVGVEAQLGPFAAALAALGAERAYVVHGAGGADELTLSGPNQVRTVGALPESSFEAVALGLEAADIGALSGGEASENLALLHGVLGGKVGPLRDAVLLNAGATLVVAGICETPAEGLERGRAAIDSGAAGRVLEGLVRVSRQVEGQA